MMYMTRKKIGYDVHDNKNMENLYFDQQKNEKSQIERNTLLLSAKHLCSFMQKFESIMM